MNDRAIRKWSRQVLEGLRYMHGLDPPVIHRDVKARARARAAAAAGGSSRAVPVPPPSF